MLLRPWYLQGAMIYRAPEGDGEGGGGEGGGEGGGDGDKQPDPRLDALENAVKTLAQGNAAINDAIARMAQGMERLSQPREEPQKKGGQDDDVDLETMDRKQFATYITSQTRSVVEEALKPLGDKFGQLDSKIDAHGLAGMIKDFQKDHPDFFEWKGEMRELLKENPTLTPARAYALVRSENPDKSKQLDKKYGLFKEEPKSKNGTDLLSLFPTGSGSATRGSTKMTPQQAAEAAWDEVMSNISGTQH